MFLPHVKISTLPGRSLLKWSGAGQLGGDDWGLFLLLELPVWRGVFLFVEVGILFGMGFGEADRGWLIGSLDGLSSSAALSSSSPLPSARVLPLAPLVAMSWMKNLNYVF